MSPFSNNHTFETLFGREDDREQSGYYTSTPRQQNPPTVGNTSCSELHWASGPHRESRLPTHLAPNTSSWPSTTFPGPPPSVYGGGAWPGDPRHDEPRLGSLSSAPGSSAGRSEVNLMGMGVATPVLEQCFPAAQRATPVFQRFPPSSSNWLQVPGAHWHPTPSWGHPVRTARQHNDQSGSIGPSAIRLENPPFQLATSSAIVGPSERRFMPTGLLPSTTISHSVQPPTSRDPVPAASSRSRGERWDLPNASMFQCLWTCRCTALIAGNGRSVRNHLRDEHNFTYDDRVIVCTWGACSTYVQRRNVPRHIVACHFAVKVTCPHCGLALSRADAQKKHELACTGATVVEAME